MGKMEGKRRGREGRGREGTEWEGPGPKYFGPRTAPVH